MAKLIDLTGNRYGLLTVISFYGNSTSNHKLWLCQCDCGNVYKAYSGNLKNGGTTDCGCRFKEKIANGRRRHGEGVSGNATKEYKTWSSIKGRCLNTKNTAYPNYGGRGITMCADWINSYENFLAYLGRAPSKLHSIDRKDNDGNYEPGNCRWATKKEQANNRRSNRLIQYNGQIKSISEWAVFIVAHYDCLFGRLKNGWSIDEAITTPIRTLLKK